MINKKTIAVKESVRGQIIGVTSDMTPAELAKAQLTVAQVLSSRGLPGILSQIGRVYEVPFTDGRKTLSVILTYEGIRSLGISLNTVFRGCGGKEVFKEGTDVTNGVLVNLDLYQQVALLRAVIAKKPDLAGILGLYNLRGSRKVYEALSKEGVPRQLDIWWMWTGDRYVTRQGEDSYPEEGIVALSSLPTLEDYRFVHRNFDLNYWLDLNPVHHYHNGAAVFGAQR